MPPDRRPFLAVAGVVLLGLAVLGLGGYIVWQLRPLPAPPLSSTPLPPPAAASLPTPTSPPASTAAPGDALAVAPAARPPLPALPDLPALDDDPAAQAERVRQDVLDLRGLPPAELTPHLVDRAALAAYARARCYDPAALDALAREGRALQTLGLLPPGFDLTAAALNRVIDPVGALYDPAAGAALVSGPRFGAVQRWAYAAQVDRALLEERYALSAQLQPAACQADPEPCRALAALIAGDAGLAAEQWAREYASPADRRDVLLYRAPALALPPPLSPPYLAEDLTLLTQRGLRFARYLYNQGQWLGLDRVYRDPPATTEHILHPRKYTEGEPALPVDPPAALPAGGWALEWSSVLGEWNTFLLLSVPADPLAALERDLAASAAAGWGGDHYQVYTYPDRDQLALAARWLWDSQADADEFAAALAQQANARYPGGRLASSPLPGAACWQGPGQLSCIFAPRQARPPAVLWLLAPDLETMRALRALYP